MAFSAKGLTHRSTVTGTRGMVASAHPLASLAGLRMLMQGGNAIDAAVAVAAALNVVEPYMSGLAGVGYMQIYSAARREHKVLDYCGISPQAADYQQIDAPKKHYRGPLASLVPGACAGWLAALQRYGTMDAATVFAPAIEYAEQGFALTVKNAEFIESNVEDMLEYPAAAAAYLPTGRAPRAGEVLRQLDLARTFRRIAEGGAEVFYRGDLAAQIARYLAANGGWITQADLASYQPEWVDPIHVDYRSYRVYAPPPPCQAIQYLETLNIMEGFDVAGLGHNSAATLHRFIEAAKLASVDRAEYTMLADPPTAGLLSKQFAASRREQIGPRAQPTGGERYTRTKLPGEIAAGNPHGWMKTECTTHFDTIDAQGNAVSVTQSLGHGFGSAVVIPGTGLAMNSFMYWFDLEPTSPNVLAPNCKVEMCLSPAQVWDKDGLRLLIGTPGSYGILQTTPQMIMNVLDHGMNVQAAIEAPRVKATTPGYLVDAEERIPAQVLAELAALGHEINRLEAYSAFVGGGQGIMVDGESGAFMGGADPRRDGYALGW